MAQRALSPNADTTNDALQALAAEESDPQAARALGVVLALRAVLAGRVVLIYNAPFDVSVAAGAFASASSTSHRLCSK